MNPTRLAGIAGTVLTTVLTTVAMTAPPAVAGTPEAHDHGARSTTRASLSSAGGQANAPSGNPALSYDGRYVAFSSAATNLVSGDTNGVDDVFVRDRRTGQTTRVSVSSAGAQGNDLSDWPALSADGRYVSFRSAASNLVPADTNDRNDVFVRDLRTGRTTRVSVSSGEVQANGHSFASALSADGRYVAFDSGADNLVAGDSNGDFDAFVRDQRTGTTTRVGVSSGGAEPDLGAGWPDISADGRYVTFSSNAANLVPGDTNIDVNGRPAWDVFVHDRRTGATTRVSVSSAGEQGDSRSHNSFISADGRYVVFSSFANNLVPDDTPLIGRGRTFDVFVHDRRTGKTTRANVSSAGAQADDEAALVARLSGNGRFVTFSSAATNLVPGDTNRAADVFVHRR